MPLALAASALLAGGLVLVLGLSALEAERCPPLEERLGEVVHGPRGWSGLVLYEQFAHGDACLTETTLALYAPGESWEAEALLPRTVLLLSEVPITEEARDEAMISWESDALRIAMLVPDHPLVVVEAQRMSTSERQGSFFRCGAPPIPAASFRWSAVPRASATCLEIGDAR